MRTDVDQTHRFSQRGYVIEALTILLEILFGKAYGTRIFEYQFFQSRAAIARHRRKSLFRDREYTASGVSRMAIVEDADLLSGNVLLEEQIGIAMRQSSTEFFIRMDDPHTFSPLAGVGFYNDRKAQSVVVDEAPCEAK